jgi:transcription initiation factor TFIIB
MLSNFDSIDTDDFDDEDIWNLLDSIGSDTISDTIISKKKLKEQCINCKGYNLVNDQSKGYIKCIDCGVCNSQTFDENPEWSQYEDGKGEGSMRCGAATNYFLPISSLGTTISGKGFSILQMLQNWNQMPYKERSLSVILQYIDQMCRKKNIPKAVIDNAKILYKQIHDLKYININQISKSVIIRGKNRKGIYGAVVYYGAQLQGFARTQEEVAEMFSINMETMTKGCRKFMDLMKNNKLINTIETASPNNFIERFCYKLKFKKDQIKDILIIATNISKLNLASNHQPSSIATGAIIIYTNINGINLQKKTISEIFNISVVTIDKIYKKILPFRKVIVSDELTDFVKHKLASANYYSCNDATTETFKQHLIELSETSSINNSYTNDILNDSDNLDDIMIKSEVIIEKKKRGRKKKEISNII